MSEQQFPTREQIEQRIDQIIDGFGYPHLPALPGIVFRRLTLAERGEVSRAYSKFLKEDMTQGGRFSEFLMPTELRRRCREVGLDYDELMAQEESFQQRTFDQAPADLRGPATVLTDEEFEQLTPEAQQSYRDSMIKRGEAIKEFLLNLFTPEERTIRAQIAQVQNLETHLKQQTYEHHARVHRMLEEILRGARRADDLAEPYFGSIDELYELQETDPTTWLSLSAKWREFREGKWPGFTPRSSSTPGAGSK